MTSTKQNKRPVAELRTVIGATRTPSKGGRAPAPSLRRGRYVSDVRVELIRESLDVPRESLSNPGSAATMACRLIGRSDREHLLAFLVDVHLRLVGVHTVTVGTLTSVLCNAAGLFRAALLAAADGVVLAHNHPSGDPALSDDDRRAFAALSAAGKLFDIKVHDLVAVTSSGLWSSAATGRS